MKKILPFIFMLFGCASNQNYAVANANEGKIVAAHMAGNHYDPEQTGKFLLYNEKRTNCFQ